MSLYDARVDIEPMGFGKYYERAVLHWVAANEAVVHAAILEAFSDNEDFAPIWLPAPPDFCMAAIPAVLRIDVEQQRIYL